MLDDFLNDAIDLSKLRCSHDHGLKRDARLNLERLTDYEIRERYEAVSPILARNAGSFGKLRQLAKESGYCVLITDPNCVVVEQYCDSNDAQNLAKLGLKCGTIWGEEQAGTNGLGLCADTKHVLTVSGDDHYFNAFEKFTCTSAPLLGDEGELLGVVNLSGGNKGFELNAGFVRHVVSEIADQIQGDVFRQNNQSSFLIEVREGGTVKPNALLALSYDGKITSITPSAAEIINLSSNSSDLLGHSISDYLDADIDDLIPSIGTTQYFELSNNRSCFITPQSPPKSWQTNGSGRTRLNSKISRSPIRKSFEGKAEISPIIGTDHKMRRIADVSQGMLKNGSAIILAGEAGVGKVSFARALHTLTSGTDLSTKVINCALLQEYELQSTLTAFFSMDTPQEESEYPKGEPRTLILKDMDELSVENQTILLNMLSSDSAFSSPLNSRRRIVCTTNADLHVLQDDKYFRSELLYLLKGAWFKLPALRERSDFDAFIQEYIANLSREQVVLTSKAKDALHSHNWPGNIPEMTNALRFALACSDDGSCIEVGNLPQDILFSSTMNMRSQSGNSVSAPHSPLNATLNESRTGAEKQRITQALLTSAWNVSDATKCIGISRATMYRKMKEFGIERPISEFAN